MSALEHASGNEARRPGGSIAPGYLAPGMLFLLVLPTNHTMALRMFCLVGTVAAAFLAARRHGCSSPPLRWPFLAWVILALASLAWSRMPAFSVGEIKTEIGYGLAAFLSFFVLTKDDRELRLWLHAAVGALALSIVLSLVGYANGHAAGVSPYMRWDAVHGYASFSTYLSAAVPLLVLWFWSTGSRMRYAGWLVVTLLVIAASLLGNRMFWLAAGAGLTVTAAAVLLRSARRGTSQRRVLMPLCAAVALCIILFLSIAGQRPADYARPAEAHESTGLTDVFARSERLYIWAFWLDRIGEHPWTGVGFGRDLPHWVYEKPKEWPDLYFAHAHNMLLDYGLQMGIPGMLVLLWIFASIAAQFWRCTRDPDEQVFKVGATGLALVVSFFSKNMVDDLFWRTDALVFWSFAGILLGYAAGRRRRDPEAVSVQ